MNVRSQLGPLILILFLWCLGFSMIPPVLGSVKPSVWPTLSGYHKVTPKRVLMEIYIDFYCPHCHDFVTTVLPAITKEFEPYVEVQFIGLPVVESATTLPFEIYEAARLEGKGKEMVHLLFETLQIRHQSVQPSEMQEALYQRLGLDSERMTGHLEPGRALQNFEKEVQRALAMGLDMTPVVIIEGKYLVINTSAANLRPILYNALYQKIPDSAT